MQTLQCFQKKLNLFFAHENIKKRASKVAHHWPKLFFHSPAQPTAQWKIDFSYYKYVPRLICLLICVVKGWRRWTSRVILHCWKVAAIFEIPWDILGWSWWWQGQVHSVLSCFCMNYLTKKLHRQKGHILPLKWQKKDRTET